MSLIKYTVEIVKSYVFRNEISTQEIPGLIEAIHQSLVTLSGSAAHSTGQQGNDFHELSEHLEEKTSKTSKTPKTVETVETAQEKQVHKPFVSLDQVVSHDAIICLICGKPNKAIKGHLSKTHGIDVATYRENFSLPKDFPMVAPAYSEKRRQLAIDAGLGEKLQAGRDRKKRL